MKLVTFKNPKGKVRIGWLRGEGIVDMKLADNRLPANMLAFIDGHERYFDLIKSGDLETKTYPHYTLATAPLLAPLPNPRSFRDYIGFEQHMLNASKSFGHTVGEAWYEVPIFYFTNHHGIFGPDEDIPCPEKETRLDIELEIAVIIGKKGKNIKAAEADDYIFGYTVFNDWTARAIQKHEMTVPLGPHKGKDFANAIGPCIVTKDELESRRLRLSDVEFPEHLRKPTYPERADRYNLKMTAKINGQVVCEGNYNTVYWTFPQMIERAAENGVTLMPGDILGSGTVGWGSLVENNFSVHRPLVKGDKVELEIEGIGILRNRVV